MLRPRFLARAFPLALALSSSSQADLTIHIKETHGASTSTRIQYYKPPLWRTELPDGNYVVGDSASHGSFTVDTPSRRYFVNDVGGVRRPASPDQTIVADIETKDTGERRSIFGHAARHILTTQRRHMEYRNQAPGEVQEIVTEGWYLDISGPFPMLSRAGAVAFLTNSRDGDPVPSITVHVTGRAPLGVPVWEMSGDHLLEITHLSEAPLDPKLFQPPPGFRRIFREPSSGPSRFEWYWQQFLDWLGGVA